MKINRNKKDNQRRSTKINDRQIAIQSESRHLKMDYPVDGEIINQLTIDECGLVPCRVSSDKDYYVFNYDTNGLQSFDSIRNSSLAEKYEFLINAGDLVGLTSRFSFSLDPENILVDIAHRPKIMDRGFESDTDVFLADYKALAGTTLDETHTFDDFRKGGGDLYTQNKTLERISKAKTVSEVVSVISDAAIAEHQYNEETFTAVRKNKYKVMKILLPVFGAVMILALGLAIYEHFIKGKENEKYLSATEQYFAEDYKSVGKSISAIDEVELSEAYRYMAATSAVKSSGLNTSQRENVLKAIDQFKTNTDYLNYWVMIGRQDYEAADQYAQKFRDDEHRVFALALRRSQVEKDSSISGTEKTEMINSLDETINELMESIKEDKLGLTNGAVEGDENVEADNTPENRDDDGSENDEPKLLD